MGLQKTVDLILAGLSRISTGEAARSCLPETRYTITGDRDSKINRPGAFAPADAKRIALFQANVLVIDIQKSFLPKMALPRCSNGKSWILEGRRHKKNPASPSVTDTLLDQPGSF